MPHPKLNRASIGGGDFRHPEGGYVITITDATDHEADGYVDIGYDIAEGDKAGHYEFAHDFRRYYESSFPGATQFEKFLSALEVSNPGFDLERWETTWDCSKLVGLVVGAVFKKRMYTTDRGEDRESPKLVYCCAADDIREGRFKVPEPEDARVQVHKAAASVEYVSDEDLPF